MALGRRYRLPTPTAYKTAADGFGEDVVMWIRLVIGVVLLVVGGVWIGQGVGAVHGSFMTDQPEWAVIGAIAVVFGIALLVGANRDRRERNEPE